MIVDTSALVAVVMREPGHETILERLTGPSVVAAVGAPTLVELGIVLSARLDRDARPIVADLLELLDLGVIPFTDDHWPVAVRAFMRFGRGRHPAALNFGDCLTYAIASLADEPLLFVGDDFAQTDLVPA